MLKTPALTAKIITAASSKSRDKLADNPSNFGTVTIQARKGPRHYKNTHVVATVDRSGSMLDTCSDGKTKMEHIKHTLKNIMNCLSQESAHPPTLHIYGFDTTVDTICVKRCDKELSNLESSKMLENLVPRGATDINAAIITAATVCEKINHDSANSDESPQIIHMHLTDGMITSGEHRASKIRTNINTENTTNAFIGYGDQHSADLLQSLAEVENGQYYFIDTLENAGMVYGEILYNTIYEQAKNVIISVTDGVIYDYKTNTWVEKLKIPSFASEQSRTYQIKTSTDACRIDISYVDSTANSTATIQAKKTVASNNDHVEIYWLRQLTQEFMYEAKTNTHQMESCNTAWSSYNSEIHCLLDYAKSHNWHIVWKLLGSEDPITKANMINACPYPRRYRLLHHAVEQNNAIAVESLIKMGAILSPTADNVPIQNLTQDPKIKAMISCHDDSNKKPLKERLLLFLQHLKDVKKKCKTAEHIDLLQTLSDDIYIAIRSLTSNVGQMYMGARCESQGKGRAYVVRDTASLEKHQTQEGQSTYRSMSAEHNVSTAVHSRQASIGTVNYMNNCSK